MTGLLAVPLVLSAKMHVYSNYSSPQAFGIKVKLKKC